MVILPEIPASVSVRKIFNSAVNKQNLVFRNSQNERDLVRYFCGILSDDLFTQFFVIQFHYISIRTLLFCLAVLHVQYRCNILQLVCFNYLELIKGIIKKLPNFKISKFFRNSLVY